MTTELIEEELTVELPAEELNTELILDERPIELMLEDKLNRELITDELFVELIIEELDRLNTIELDCWVTLFEEAPFSPEPPPQETKEPNSKIAIENCESQTAHNLGN